MEKKRGGRFVLGVWGEHERKKREKVVGREKSKIGQ